MHQQVLRILVKLGAAFTLLCHYIKYVILTRISIFLRIINLVAVRTMLHQVTILSILNKPRSFACYAAQAQNFEHISC